MCLHFRDYISSGGFSPTVEHFAAKTMTF
jgi:hypothetical protein